MSMIKASILLYSAYYKTLRQVVSVYLIIVVSSIIRLFLGARENITGHHNLSIDKEVLRVSYTIIGLGSV